MPRDVCGLGAKSTVTPSPCAGSESVAVSPARDELLEQGPCEVAQIEARQRSIAEVHEPEAELPALAARLAIDEAGLAQGREHA